MFRHKIAVHNNTIESRGYPKDVNPPGPPENLVGTKNHVSGDVLLTWEPPSSDGPVFYYEMFVNGSFYANVSDLELNYSNPVNQDEFKVRSVGVLGLKSGFSNVWIYEEGLTLNPWATGINSSAHIMWTDISGSVENLTIEGYNVYLGGVKQNSSLLTTDFIGYPFFDLDIDTEYELGVSFEYNGGQESAVFPANVTPPGSLKAYQIDIYSSWVAWPLISNRSLYIHRGSGYFFGILVEEQGVANIIPSFKPNKQIDKRQWSTIEEYIKTYSLEVVGGPYQRSRLHMNRRCGEWAQKTLLNTFKQVTLDLTKHTDVFAEIDVSYQYVFVGPPCEFITNYSNITFIITLPEASVIKVGRDSNKVDGYSVIELPQDDSILRTLDNQDNMSTVLNWTVYPSIPYHNIYIKLDTDTNYPTDPYNDELLDLEQNKFVIDDLAEGVYNAKLEYVMYDKATVIQTTNEVTFSITSNA